MDNNFVDRILIRETWDKDSAILLIKDLASILGFSKTEQVIIATVTSELGTNILRFAKKGELIMKVIRNDKKHGLEILAIDNGPGISNIELAMQENYSTLPGSLGLGLPSIKRNMDEFEIKSNKNNGTRILVRKWLPNEEN